MTNIPSVKPVFLNCILAFAVLLQSIGCANAQETAEKTVEQTSNQSTDSTQTITPKQAEKANASQLHKKTVTKGIDYLLLKGQDRSDGSYSKALGPAVTAMCTTALLKNGVRLEHPQIQKSLKYLEGFVRADGGVYAPKSNLRNYETSVAVMCFVAANKDGKYDKIIQEAVGFQKNIQWDDGEGHDRASTFFGGQGYGNHKRPDMSNTSFFVDALKASGEDADSVAMKKALEFISRTQNLNNEHNVMEYASKATADDRGGFIYTPVGEGESKAGKTPEGGLRSYASMTYAGLKSFLYAGLDKKDIRVQAALDWIRRHYDLETNPGMGKQGLFYYYHVFAKALDAFGDDELVDKDGNKHNWRAELTATLAKQQSADGSWVNEADRWFEGDPNLVASYSMLALSYCGPDQAKKTGKQ